MSEVNTTLSAPFVGHSTTKNTRMRHASPHPSTFYPILCPAQSDYQGMIFLTPFFFLLLDSFFFLSLVPVWVASCAEAASVFVPSVA